MGPTSHELPQGRRHFQHGPIDIIAYAEGDPSSVAQAHETAWHRFGQILPELVQELADLRKPVQGAGTFKGPIAQSMWQACKDCLIESDVGAFLTPMAAVAGSVAQDLSACYQAVGIKRAWVNKGGDIALHLTEDTAVSIGLFADLARLDEQQLLSGIQTDAVFEVKYGMGIRGVATSGWRGRSFSFGIADSVTVFAASASQADAAATMIANAVNVADARIVRQPANTVKDDSDLGQQLVTVSVPKLSQYEIDEALEAGLKKAHVLKQNGLICACVLSCQGWFASTETTRIQRMFRGDDASKYS
jgi:ApbE superfamily uncharacterized protein (UPF0280 family)